MQTYFCLTLSLTLFSFFVDAAPANLIYEDLNFEDPFQIEEEDLDEFGKLLDAADVTSKSTNSNSKVNVSGSKNKKIANKGAQSKHNIQDLKKFYKLAGVHDQDSFNDDDGYSESDGIEVGVVGESVNENNKFRKGSKTRGFHRVHHKDEYKKDKVFYEDDESSGNVRRVGGGGIGFVSKAGRGLNKGHHHHDRQKGIYGRQGYLDEGSLDKQLKGYSDSQNFGGSFSSKS